MSVESFRKAYKESDIKQLGEFIKQPKVMSIEKIMTYIEKSFVSNRTVYDVLILILFNQYILNEVIAEVIKRDNTDLLENILNNDYGLELDENLILLTLPKGRVSMAKAIYEYVHKEYGRHIVIDLLLRYDFVFNMDEKSIDSFILSLHLVAGSDLLCRNIIPYINPNFFDNYAIVYATTVTGHDSLIDQLLLHPNVDPGVSDNFIFERAIEEFQHYQQANKLFKHPRVFVSGITMEFVVHIVKYNWLCAAEKILRLGDDQTTAMFRNQMMIDKMIKNHNDVTYLAIKLGVFDVSFLIRHYPDQKAKIKWHLRNLKIDDTYIYKSYEHNMDPFQVIRRAFRRNDVHLAKTIVNYPISINGYKLLHLLCKYENDVSNYIYTDILIKYNPIDIIMAISKITRLCVVSVNILTKVFSIIADEHDLNYDDLYDKYDNISDIISAYIKTRQ